MGVRRMGAQDRLEGQVFRVINKFGRPALLLKKKRLARLV